MMLWKRHKKSCDEMSTSNEMESKSIAIELAEAISDIEAALSAMNSDLERDLALDEAAMNAAKDEIYARRDILKAIARRILAEHLGNASATSKLSAEMLINDKEAMPKSDNITIFP